eukprot:CAMPEP_0170544168 /NCGR_PEP_ID=MMETSP0211-20121228/3034_1 /TAXON_ID=311385 /ORGANISM="Pseudokeronopsis sp., Strain OXSARD2" /LENGTH=67 /DNA_ID=CAMNT_0010847761 /DNA_START=1030 /DNA_END=1233 /DNA_ORIENTATION=-
MIKKLEKELETTKSQLKEEMEKKGEEKKLGQEWSVMEFRLRELEVNNKALQVDKEGLEGEVKGLKEQ